MKRCSILCCVAFCFAIPSVTTADLHAEDVAVQTLQFGVYASDKPSTMFGKFKPILSHLETTIAASLGRRVKIKLRIFNSYDSANDALVEGKVDFVRFGPASYVIAKKRNKKIELLGKELNNGKGRFQGLIIVRKDSVFKTVKDLRGKRFAFGDENSTIGRFLSQALLLESGIRWSDFSKAEYLGRHDRVATAVLQGDFDAGAVKSSTFKKYEKHGLVVLAPFWNVTKPWVARAGMDKELLKSLRHAVISANDTKVLKRVGKSLSGFAEAKDSDFDVIRQGMKAAEEFSSPADSAVESVK